MNKEECSGRHGEQDLLNVYPRIERTSYRDKLSTIAQERLYNENFTKFDNLGISWRLGVRVLN